MQKIKTLIVSDPTVKKLFKVECAKNSTDMSEVTAELWKQYILNSVRARQARAAEYKKIRDGES